MAHADQPLQERNIHISAPHIYGSALEALDLTPNSTLSFLNVGSGTGYMSCIVAAILGSCSTNYGIEIHQDVVDHCNAAIASWKSTSRGGSGHLQIIQGDALNVALDQGEAIIGFDRIYIGASVHRRCLPKLRSLLKTGGILVGPGELQIVEGGLGCCIA
jgi:protein-L-isoaspartate O-methyltransferase